jgi:hypothetical protein
MHENSKQTRVDDFFEKLPVRRLYADHHWRATYAIIITRQRGGACHARVIMFFTGDPKFDHLLYSKLLN